MLHSSKFHVRRIHVTSKIFLRKVGPKTSFNVENHEFSLNKPDVLSSCQNSCHDYLGIESDENLITVIPQKHRIQQPQISESKEKFYRTSFGIVRFDADNKLKYHGEHENKAYFNFPHNSSEDAKVSNISEKLSACGNQTLQNLFFKNSRIESSIDTLNTISNERLLTRKNHVNKNYIEESYFGTSEADSLTQNNAQPVSEELNYLEKDYFQKLTHSSNTPSESDSECVTSKAKVDSVFYNQNQVEKLNYLEKDKIKILTRPENVKIEQNCTDYSNSKTVDCGLGDGEQSYELNYLDKNYFGTLSNSEDHTRKNLLHNTVNKKWIDPAVDIDKQDALSKINNFTSSIDELNLPDNSHENYSTSIDQNSLSYNDLLKTSSHFNKDSNVNNENICKNSNERCQNKELDFIDALTQKPNYKANFKKLFSQKTQGNDIMFNKYTEPLVKKSNLSKEICNETDKSFSTENNLKFSKSISEVTDQNDEMSTAHDFVQKLREEEKITCISKGKITSQEKFDSKGFRILKNQVPNLAYFTHDEILNILKQNVVYSDDDLLILNKPYSLVIHESKTTNKPCLSTFLDDLAKEMDNKSTNPKLFTVHRLDKETTGCLLLARNETMAMHLKGLFAQRKIVKKYWVITSGVPDPPEGIIDIPISEGSINDRKRMVLHPKLPNDILYRNHSKNGKSAVTTYKVISESGSAALVEVFPKTGIKHQIRVHFGFGLGCPILGDHKYSHLDKLAPQKLPCDMLQNLHVRQSKVRHIPMHIHAKSVGIPEYFDKRDLFVNIPIPDHFKINLNRLKFKKKDMIH